MTTSRVLFWHRRDLRLADNLGLAAAAEISPAVTGVYVLDPQVINPPEHLPPMAPARLWFLIESLIELQQRWRHGRQMLRRVDHLGVEDVDPRQRRTNLRGRRQPQVVRQTQIAAVPEQNARDCH